MQDSRALDGHISSHVGQRSNATSLDKGGEQMKQTDREKQEEEYR